MEKRVMLTDFGYFGPILGLIMLLIALGVVFGRAPAPSSVRAAQATEAVFSASAIPFPADEILEHISQREGIPVGQLMIVDASEVKLIVLSQDFWFVKVFDQESGHSFGVAVNMVDGSFTDDVEALTDSEVGAHRAKYGKLEPALFERLEGLNLDDVVEVGIWVSGGPRRTDAELYEELANMFPEAREALDRTGDPFDVGEYDLINEIEAAYTGLLEQDTQARTEAILADLQGQGFETRTFGALPVVVASLPKSTVLELLTRDDVGAIYLADQKVLTQLDTAVPTTRAPRVWHRGKTGSSVDIAIVEPGKIDFTGSGSGGSNYLNQGATKSCTPGGQSDHKTRVASSAASYHSNLTGVAFGATIDDACANSDGATDITDALEWATLGSDPINASIAVVGGGGTLSFLDRAFDHWARAGLDTVIVSSGNAGACTGAQKYVTSPGKAYNVIAAGSYDHKGNASWGDDVMAGHCWVDPIDTGVEKPELVVSSENITVIGPNSAEQLTGGTSHSSAMATGMAALMIDRNVSLAFSPNAVKAIAIASAVHNIEGESRLSEEDGAGAIDVALADRVAQVHGPESSTPCSQSCWWHQVITPTSFPVSTYLNRYFNATEGTKVRVAIAWWSNADCPSPTTQDCDFDRLDTDIDLFVYDPNGVLVPGASSASGKNNYEIVEFTAPATGKYRIGAYRYSLNSPPFGEDSNRLGIAWANDATYLPDVRSSYNGWDSEIHIRNDGATTRDVKVSLFNTGGSYVGGSGSTCNSLPANGKCKYNPGLTGFSGSAIVDGGEDLSVMTLQEHTGPETWSAYSGINEIAADVNVPLLHKNNYGYYSNIYIQNTGTTLTNITVNFKAGPAGSSCTQTYNNIPRRGLKIVTLSSVSCVGSTFVGSAYITNSANQLIAVTATQHKTDSSTMLEWSSASLPATSVYAPLIQNYNYGWSSGMTIQNASSSTNTINTAVYGQSGGGSPCYINSTSVGSRFSVFLYSPGNPPCPAVTSGIFDGGSLPVAGVINQVLSGSNFGTDYYAVTFPGHSVSFPIWINDTNNWISGLTIQNVSGTETATYRVNYYYSNGSAHPNFDTGTLQPHEIALVADRPGTINGSAVVFVTSGGPVAVVSNLIRSPSGDGGLSYSGIHR